MERASRHRWRVAWVAAGVALSALWGRDIVADSTVTVNPRDDRGVWEGWGASLAWWGQGVGGGEYQDLHADLLFTTKTVSYLGQDLPGLGLNIVRYNVGGGGRGESSGRIKENVSAKVPWYKDIDGFWINGQARSPTSKSWDFTRDANQRAMLQAASKRGVTWVEFFAVSPMWWMTDSRSSAGGRLLQGSEADLAHYLASVAKKAQADWGVKVHSIAPFNEPSAGWWKFPLAQEGCGISRELQKNVIAQLRGALAAQGLGAIQIAASDRELA